AAGDSGRPPKRFRTRTCPNAYAWIVERGAELLKRDGRFGMIVPVSAVSGPEYAPLRDLFHSRPLWVSTYSNRPAKLFDGVEQRLALLLAGPEGETTRHASPYQHWYEAERPHLFDRLAYTRASLWPPTGAPIKSGHPLAESVFRKLHTHAARLPHLSPPTPVPTATPNPQASGPAVWLHDGPTYWVRALSFPPAATPGAGSAHYHRIPVADQETARVLAAILSSAHFYFFFKMVSNCRDLGRRIWSEFPINPLLPERWHALADMGEALEHRLRETAAQRRRIYPGGPVTYAEYYPARARDLIDRIDTLLAEHYGLTAEELRYLLAYDQKYRGAAPGTGPRP
ncbi:MAG TPA: hypothetical protein VFU47_12145, partial [Armatimonadota bacterium]|nr:hypothetical protein [Armatimonadota bacterium]